MTANGPCVVFAGGGSGGHISPGLAVAEELQATNAAVLPRFICSTRPIDSQMLTQAGAAFDPLAAHPFSLRPRLLAQFLLGWRGSVKAASRILETHAARAVVSLGGFVTPPVATAARRLRIPLLLLNLDATPGKANRWVARRAALVLSAVPTPGLPAFASRIVGMPIRRIALAPASAAECRAELGLEPDRKTLLITGASQGSAGMNAAMAMFAQRNTRLLDEWQILHLCGQRRPEDLSALAESYRAAGVRAAVVPFMHRMGLAWGAADLAVSRAGANSVAEAAANLVPTLFIPYPFHKDLHQIRNVQPLLDAGAAAMVLEDGDPEKTADALGGSLLDLVSKSLRRTAIRAALERLPRPQSAAAVAAEVVRLTTRAR